MERNKIIKTNKGITLIALVITIIVLLILAGVSITMLTGENGILSQAQNAKNRTEEAQSEEKNRLNEYNNILNNYASEKKLTDGSWNDEEGINTPVIKENMQLVKWDENQNKFIPDDTNSSYDYSKQEWANAEVITKDENNEDIVSYFVWIPRYEYKINADTKTIDVKFIEIGQEADEGYIIHPAFTSDINNGGWREELPGIWVGKYESSRSDAGTTVNDEGTSTKIAVRPGVTSWRNTKIGDMYTYAKEYNTNLNSHMLKNSEWGAVVYLTHSQYGRNGTIVTKNNSSNYITGSAGNSVNAKTDEGTTNKYWSTQGVLASSTGNVTGIYDLAGGAYEHIAAYYNGSPGTDLKDNGDSFASQNGTSTEYVTVYTNDVEEEGYKKGDATYEISDLFCDTATFFNASSHPFLRRGGNAVYGVNGGAFDFCSSSGAVLDFCSFRVCLIVK